MRTRSCRTVFLSIPLGLLYLGSLAGCSKPSGAQGGDKGEAAPPTVSLVKPVRQTVSHKVEQPGRIEAYEQTPLYAKIAGYVEEMKKDIGDPVRKGEVLATLRVPEMVEKLKQKDALVGQADAELKQSEAAAQAAEANVQTAKAMVQEAEAGRARAGALVKRWQSEYERLKTLGKSVLDRQTLDETEYQLDAAKAFQQEVEAKVRSAEASRDESVAKRAKAKADVDAANARLRVAQADQRETAEWLKYAEIPSPYEGVVTQRNVDTGHFVQSNVTGAQGVPLFVVAQMNPVRIFVDVPEGDAVLIGNDAKARVRIQALKGEEIAGKVKRSAWALDPKTRTLRTEIDLENPGGRLRPGMYANATITVDHENVLALPATAVVTQAEQSFCYRVENGKAVRTPIQIGFRDSQYVEVVKKAGKDGDWQDFTGMEEIAANATGLADGQAVTVSTKP